MIDFEDPLALTIILLIALIPVLIILFKSKKEVVSPETFIKFSIRDRRLGFAISFLCCLLFVGRAIFHLSIIDSAIVFILIRKFAIEYQLYVVEKSKFLIYDYEAGVLDYFDGEKRALYYMNDITSVTLYNYQLSGIQVADLCFSEKTIRLSSSLVNFRKVPFLNTAQMTVKNNYVNFLLPKFDIKKPGLDPG